MAPYADLSVPTTPRAGKYRSPHFRAVLAQLPTTECVIWPGQKDEDGYGLTKYNGHKTVAHRAVWTEVNGRIPDGLVLDHTCRNKSCVNPQHCEPVPQRENVIGRDVLGTPRSPGHNARKTHCIRGHEFTPENTRIYTRSAVETQRVCLTCEKEKNRRSEQRRKARRHAAKNPPPHTSTPREDTPHGSPQADRPGDHPGSP